jgi:hypothetical protein
MKAKGRNVLAELQANADVIKEGGDHPPVQVELPKTREETRAIQEMVVADVGNASKTGPAPEKPSSRARKSATEAQKTIYPWDDADPRIPKTFNLRFEMPDYIRLKWLGDTTFEESMHSIAMRGALQEIDRMLREREIQPPKRG